MKGKRKTACAESTKFDHLISEHELDGVDS